MSAVFQHRGRSRTVLASHH